MTRDEIRSHVLDSLLSVAPEADATSLAGNISLREQLDIDSMDFLNYVIAIHKSLQVEIPERDYAKLVTLDGSLDYLAARMK